jgi:thioredoxin reductase
MIAKLGVEIEDNPLLGPNIKVVDPTFSTSVRGVFVAEDILQSSTRLSLGIVMRGYNS